MMSTTRTSYPGDVTDKERVLLLHDLCLICEDVSQRKHSLPELFKTLRDFISTGHKWQFPSHNFPPGTAVYRLSRCRV